MRGYKRNCPNPDQNPNCKNEISYTRESDRNRAEKRNTNCKSCAMTKRFSSEEARKKISESCKGKTPWNKGKTGIYSEETLRKNSESNKGKKRSKETRKKMRLSTIKRIEDRHGIIFPNYNKSAILIIRTEAKKLKIIDLRDAETPGGEFYIKELGYWVDGYSPHKNIVIEVDESKHYKNGKLRQKDVWRQKEIEDHLNCKFIRIKI